MNSNTDTLEKNVNVSNIRVNTIPMVVNTETPAIANKIHGIDFSIERFKPLPLFCEIISATEYDDPFDFVAI